jgi:hypothetical protein
MFELLDESVKAGQTVRGKEFAYALNVVQHEGAEALAGTCSTRGS